jgi:hypothetical protein
MMPMKRGAGVSDMHFREILELNFTESSNLDE